MNQPTQKKKPLKATDVRSFLRIIFNNSQNSSATLCYRGQSNSSWTLSPSIQRSLKKDAEAHLLRELMLESPSEFKDDSLMFHRLVRAQHYGLPTRLLDVTLNPLVSLYFSCSDPNNNDDDGSVFIFDFPPIRVKFADSDVISLLSNFSRLHDQEKEEIRNFILKNPRNSVLDNERKKEFRLLPSVSKLIQFVRTEKLYFLDEAEPADFVKYYFVHPSKNNRRIIAQSGAFIVAGCLSYDDENLSRIIKTTKILIPKANKEKILTELDALNINTSSMFPGIEFSSQYIKKKWTRPPFDLMNILNSIKL